MNGDRFKNPKEVYEYLKDEWRVSLRSVYNHVHEGKLRPDSDGKYPLKAVQKYARTWLKLKETALKGDDEELRRMHEKAKIAYMTEQAKMARLKRQKEEGELVPRADFELELAARAGVLMAGFEAMVHEKAGELVRLVEGNTARLPEFMRALNDAYKELMNQYATTREFHVMFVEE